MSSTLHVASHENPYVAELLRLGILAARQRPFDPEDWELSTMEDLGVQLLQELGASSSSGVSYVVIPELPVRSRWCLKCSETFISDNLYCDKCRANPGDYNPRFPGLRRSRL